MESLALREATPSDSEFAYRAKKTAFREYVEQVWSWDEAEQRRLHEQRFAAQNFRVISFAGADVGIMAVVAAADCLKLNQLFLLPEHQSKGIGRRCMSLIMEEARRLGLPLRVRVLKVNPRALAFYRKVGLVHVGETGTHVLMEWAP